MIKEERDRVIVEELGGCWHECGETPNMACPKCGETSINFGGWYINPVSLNIDLSTPNGFFWVWDKAKDREWWPDFWNWVFDKECDAYFNRTGEEMAQDYFWGKIFTGEFGKDESLIHPGRFAEALFNFLYESHAALPRHTPKELDRLIEMVKKAHSPG